MENKDKKQDLDLKLRGEFKGHNGHVTSIVTGFTNKENQSSDLVISAGRDKTILIWKVETDENGAVTGNAHKMLTGHSHFISDMCLTYDNHFLISSSWDKTLRLWDLTQFKCTQTFVGHTKEVLSVTFSPQNRQILSSGADKTIRIWNVKAQLRTTNQENSDWVSCVRYLGNRTTGKSVTSAYFATCGWDGRLKIWSSTNIQIKDSFKAHDGNINHLAVSKHGKYIATGGKDQKIYLWDFFNTEKADKQFNAGSIVNQIAFSPLMKWVAAATDNGIKVWNLNDENPEESSCLQRHAMQSSKKEDEQDKKKGDDKKKPKKPKFHLCISLAWSATGKYLYAGFSDGTIKVYEIVLSEE